MKKTIVDVAKAANVSVATVSRVINGNYPVKRETKEIVLKVIKELNYSPNTQARDLIKKKTSTIGVVVPSISNMFFTDVVNGIEKYYADTPYSIFLCTTNNDEEKEITRINELKARNVAGIIVADPNFKNSKSSFYDKLANEIPVVFINGYLASQNISSVCNDEAAGSKLAMNYLTSKGHRDILFIRGKDSYSYEIKEKIYKEVMNEIGYFNNEYIVNIGQGNGKETVEKTINVITRVLSKNKNITAVFACNDLMGIGVINGCKRLNIKIPEDISIIGYDNIEISEMIEPKLTTIDQNMYYLGKNSGMLLDEKIESSNKISKKIILNNLLVVRDT